MMNAGRSYTQAMPPWPGLENFARFIQLDPLGLQLFAYQGGASASVGDTKTLVLLHGLGDEADTWRHVFPSLAQQHTVIALDLPGFGRSDKPPITYDIPFYKNVIAALQNQLDLQRVTLIGSSMGAAISQAIALDQPAWLEGLVLVDGSLMTKGAPLSLNLLLFMIPGLGERLYTRLRRNPQAAFETLRPYYANLEALPAVEQDLLFTRVNQRVWSDAQRRAYFSALRSLALYTSRLRGLESQLKALTLPTHIVWGEHDYIMPLKVGTATAQAQPNAHWSLIRAAGHLPHQEKPAAWLEAVLPGL